MDFKVSFPLFPFIDEGSLAARFRKFHAHLSEPLSIPAPYVAGLINNQLSLQIRSFGEEIKEALGADELILDNSKWYLEFSGAGRFPGAEQYFFRKPSGEKVVDSEEDLQGIWQNFLPIELNPVIQTYICALTIACPSLTKVVAGYWIVDDTCTSYPYLKSPLPEAAEFFEKNGILLDAPTSIDATIAWVNSQNGIHNGYSDSPASRALGFFTRLFVSEYRNDELSDLIWAVSGVEALLVEGGRSSLGQLKQKVSALFKGAKALPWLLSMLDKTYQYRSRMIHGNRNLRSSFRNDEDNDARFSEEYDSQLFSVALLVWLLQYVIRGRLREITFRTVVS